MGRLGAAERNRLPPALRAPLTWREKASDAVGAARNALDDTFHGPIKHISRARSANRLLLAPGKQPPVRRRAAEVEPREAIPHSKHGRGKRGDLKDGIRRFMPGGFTGSSRNKPAGLTSRSLRLVTPLACW